MGSRPGAAGRAASLLASVHTSCRPRARVAVSPLSVFRLAVDSGFGPTELTPEPPLSAVTPCDAL